MAQTTTQIATDAVAAIISSTSAATNLNVGSLTRSLIDGFSAEAAVLEQQIEDLVATAVNNALAQALGQAPVDATGSVYLMQFALSSSASASQTFASGNAITIPNSTLQWVTGESITVAPGATVTVTASCTTTGVITNVPANSITQLVVPVANATVTNPYAQPVVAGQDAGTAVTTQAQLSNTTAQLQRGINDSIESVALTSQITDASGNPTEQVVKSLYVDGTIPAVGYCYVYNGVGPMSTELLSQTANIIYGYVNTDGTVVEGFKPAGSTIYIIDAPESEVSISVAVFLDAGYTLSAVQSGVQYAIQQFFAQLDLSQSLSLQLLGNTITAVPGVANVQITSLQNDLPAVPYVTPPSIPILTAVSPETSTDLAAGTYYAETTFTNPWGETTGSTETSITITEGQAIQVSSITLPVGATGVNYYLSTSPGSTSVAFDVSGTGEQVTLTALPAVTTQTPPISNTAQIQGNAYVLSGTPVVTQAAS